MARIRFGRAFGGRRGPKVNMPIAKGIARAAKQGRREEAETRQAARSARSPEEQLRLLDSRPGASTRERRRLEDA